MNAKETMPFTGKKQEILNAAVLLLAQKGKKTTIAEVATSAGVKDSIIYHYFENKRDLFFYAIGELLKKIKADLEHHLQGIREPVSRLSKLIWFQLFCHEHYPEYAKFTIFECRADVAFFQHEASRPFIQWIKILDAIIEDGISDGTFSRALSVPVANAIILGLLDMENIQNFSGQRVGNTESDFDDILDLVLPMVTAGNHEKKKKQEKGESILLAAEKNFAEKGYEQTTTIEIARSAEVAEATLYEYFKNKENILFSTLRQRFTEHLQSMDELFVVRTPAAKLERFIRDHYFLYFKQPAFLKTFISAGVYNEYFYRSQAYDDFLRYLQIIDDILEEGKKDGSFRSNINNRIFKNLFFGGFCHMVLRWLHSNPSRYHSMAYVLDAATSMLLKAIMQPPETD